MPNTRYCRECGAEPLHDDGLCRGCWWEKEAGRLERLRAFDTGSEKLPAGLMLEYTRLDGMWQKLVCERDEARAEVERLTKERAENQARFAAVDGVLRLYLGREDDDQTQSLREYILRDKGRLVAVLTALVDDSEGQQHRVAWQDACEVLHGHRGPEVG